MNHSPSPHPTLKLFLYKEGWVEEAMCRLTNWIESPPPSSPLKEKKRREERVPF